jgi:hypothetical protein
MSTFDFRGQYGNIFDAGFVATFPSKDHNIILYNVRTSQKMEFATKQIQFKNIFHLHFLRLVSIIVLLLDLK